MHGLSTYLLGTLHISDSPDQLTVGLRLQFKEIP